ncbi:MAG TPA: PAS domain S-box protein, partial [Candidatus Acidoferrales bacterium]|nr:PAS domain S-box protein [Candidatus Acidoferrales bacterium]
MTPKDHPTARLDDQLFYDAFKASPIGIALENLEGQPLFVNPALCSMLGFREEEMLRKHCVEFSPPEDAKRDWALFEQLRAGSIDHYSLEKRFIRRDGSLIWGRLTISLLNRRTSPLVVAMVEDITEKRTVQETLELATKRMAAVARCSRDFRYLWANQRLADLLERPLGEIVGRPIVEVLGTELFEVLRPYFERALAGENVTYEEEVTYPSIGRRWISATYTPTFDAGGIADGWVAVIVDITERKRAEEALRRSEGYLAEAQRLAHSGSWAWNVPTGDAFWSQEMFRILGYDPEKTSPSLSQFLARVHPEDRARMEQVVRQEITGLNVNVLSDYRIVLPDGTIKHLHAIAHPVRNELGEVVEVVGTSMDVTERKLTEEALRESEERFRLVANTAPVMIWMSGTDMLCTYLNQAWLDFTGRSLEHELGNGWTEGLYPGDLERWLDIETKAIGRRESYQMEYRVRRHDGEYRWILQSGVPRFNPDGSFAGYIGSAIDITERKLAEEALALMSQKLIRAQEEERTRLAREL